MITRPQNRRFKPPWLLLAVAVGGGAGLGAFALIESISFIAGLASRLAGGPISHWYLLLTVPIALFLAGWLTDRFGPEVAGHGVPRIIESLALRGGFMRGRVAPLKLVATALTVGGGGSVGREGSIAQIGAAIGSWIGRTLNLSEDEVRVLVAAGAGAGIAATFNAPIAGMLFALEVVLSSFALRHLHTVVVASVTGAVVSHSLVGESLTFQVPRYALDDPAQLLLFGALGLAAVAAGLLFLAALDLSERYAPGLKVGTRLLVFAGTVAVLATAFPQLAGTGQSFVAGVVSGTIEKAWWLLLLLGVLKVVATTATLGGKGAGGIFMPSLFIGASVGAAFAQVASSLWTTSPIAPGAFALVGMAATFSAVARAPLTAILIVFETTGDYGMVIPLMLATTLATYLANRFHPESAYTAPLVRMGIHPVRLGRLDLLDTVTVGDVAKRDVPSVTEDTRLADAAASLRMARSHGMPVVDDVGNLIGLVSDTDIGQLAVTDPDEVVASVMTRNPVTVTPRTTASEAMARMASLSVGRLPVVDAQNPRQLIGMFGRAEAVAAYHFALGTAARDKLNSEEHALQQAPSARFYELHVEAGSPAEDREIRDLAWPEGCLVVSVQRGPEILVAEGDVRLRPFDSVTVFGRPELRDQIVSLLGAHPLS